MEVGCTADSSVVGRQDVVAEWDCIVNFQHLWCDGVLLLFIWLRFIDERISMSIAFGET